jgi:tetratricopeptide (TPR) repeat protein
LKSGTVNPENESEALRGLVRCFYQLKDYNQSSIYAQQLLMKKDISTDDKAVAWLVLGKSQQLQNNYTEAITSFKSCAAINRSAWGAEARFEYANSYLLSGNITAAEKAAMVAIREIGGYDYWINCAYILLGDIFMAKKDFFNAKATYQSIVDNSTIADLKLQAQQKLDLAIEKEKKVSKLDN